MLINNKAKKTKLLKAVSTDHKIKGFEDIKKEYTIFNSDMNTYNIILSNEKNCNDEIFRALSKFFKAEKRNEFDIDGDSFLDFISDEEKLNTIATLVRSIEYGSVTPWTLKTSKIVTLEHNLVLTAKEHIDYAEEIKVVSEAQTFARQMQDTSSNHMQPGAFEKTIKEKFKNVKNVKISVLDQAEMTKKGMGLILGVGQGALNEIDKPRMMVIEFLNNPEAKDDIRAYVGKGVCFDTGGLNIKTGGHMRWMKYDMSGAAISAMTIYSFAKNNVKVNAYAVCPLVLNLCGSNGQRPDDVVTSYSGKTVEIDNTDAEGRLILGDALTYAAKDINATMVFEISTLTGAMTYALGETYTGVWATNDRMWSKVEKSAHEAGELVWRLPFHHDYLDLLKSNYADIANSVSDPRGGSSRAAAFLKEFVLGKPFVHFDIASTGDKGNAGTGAILHTFYHLAKRCNKTCNK